MEYCLRQDERFDSQDALKNLAEEAGEEAGEEAALPERAVMCAGCGHQITRTGEKTRIGGEFSHRFTNPHGFMFLIGCFSSAPGCGITGYPTEEFSWFPGYAWRFAFCGGCGTHLGWEFFKGGSRSFFGLILDRLTES
jgi:hypothetical protein